MTEGEFICQRVGTEKWCVAGRLTDRLRLKGYDLAIHPKRYRKLFEEYERLHGK